MIRSIALVGSLTLMIGSAIVTPTAPAAAGGSFDITLTPKGKKAKILRKGLTALSWTQRLRNQGRVEQSGSGNSARLTQMGTGNTAGIFQNGHGHSSTITQTGNGNTFGVFQFGRNTRSNVTQTGDGSAGLLLQGGW